MNGAFVALAASLEGRRLNLTFAGRAFEALVHWVGVRDGDEAHQVRVELRDVAYDGWRIDSLEIVADEVRLEALPDGTLTACGVRVDGCTPLAPVVAWLDQRSADWRLAVGPGGQVEARDGGSPGMRVDIEASVTDGEVHLELCGVGRGGGRLALPGWLRLRRTVPLPALPLGAEVVDARRRGDMVEFRLTIPSVSRSLTALVPAL